jgi:hypothetical protein
VKFPQKGLRERPAIIAGDSLAKLLKRVDESMPRIGRRSRKSKNGCLARWTVLD